MTYFLTFLAIFALPSWAMATDFEFLGRQGDWEVFVNNKTNATVCYIASVPSEASHSDKRGDIYVLVTLRKSEGFKDVVSFHQGYPLKEGKDVQVSIGGNSFKLFPSGQTAWTYESKDDVKLVKAMRAGSTMQTIGISTRGTETTDTYSLKGISAAYGEMRKICK